MKGTTNQRYTTALVSPKPIINPSRHYNNRIVRKSEQKKKKKKRKKKKKKKKKKNPNSTPNGKLGNTSFAPTTRMELRRPHPGIHVRSTPKRTTSSFYTPIKFRRENNPQKKKKKGATWQQTRNEGLLSTVQAHDKSPTWRSSTLITVSHIRETGDST